MYSQIINPMTGQVHDGVIERDSDGAFIPLVEGNRHYAEYKKWLEEGNTPNPPAPPPQPSTPPKVELPQPISPEVKQYIDDQFDQRKGG